MQARPAPVRSNDSSHHLACLTRRGFFPIHSATQLLFGALAGLHIHFDLNATTRLLPVCANSIYQSQHEGLRKTPRFMVAEPRTPDSSQQPLGERRRRFAMTRNPTAVIAAVAQLPWDDRGAYNGVQGRRVRVKPGTWKSSVRISTATLIGLELLASQAPVTEPQHQSSQGAKHRHACSGRAPRLIILEETSGWSPPVEFLFTL